MDSRFYLKVELQLYGEEYKREALLNWSPDVNYLDVDARIVEWFAFCYADAYGKYQDAIYDANRERREREGESQERAELARLKAKYETR